MSLTDKNIVYEDYKYVLQDTGSVSIGAKYSFEELLAAEDVPFKFKTICAKYLFEGMDNQTTLESLVYYTEPAGFSYECLKQLKCKVKYAKPVEHKGLFGKKETVFKQFESKIDDFASLTKEEKENEKIIVQEIVISKLALMMLQA